MKDRNGVCVLLEAHVRAHSTAVLLAKVVIIKFNKRTRKKGSGATQKKGNNYVLPLGAG